MHPLPEPLPAGAPPRRPTAYLGWLARHQWVSIALGTALDTVWLCTLAFTPWAIGRTIDEGVATGDLVRLLLWAGIVLAFEAVHSVVEGLRDRGGIINWMRATYRSIGLISRHAARAGYAIGKRVSTGEIGATVTGDAMSIAHLGYLVGAFIAALLSYGIVGAILLGSSVPLGLLVLVGVPLSSALFFVVVRPLRTRQADQRAASGRMTALAADTVAGLRVLRGAGGEAMFVDRYQRASDETKAAGIRLATPLGLIDAIQVLIPGCFIVALTWAGALLVQAGHLTPGQLVSFYGYAGFLVMPIRLAAEAVSAFTRGQVGAGRVLGVLAVEPLTAAAGGRPPAVGALHDDASGLHLEPGRFVALVGDDAASVSALLDRLARLDDTAPDAGGVRWGADPLSSIALPALRARIVRADADPFLFRGTLRDAVDPHGTSGDDAVSAAVHAAAAGDVVESVQHGLAGAIGERGRLVSGGQRQRIGLARALALEPEWLLLENPTSAVDSHTEAIIAGRLRRAREGRSTLVATTSPMLLAEADEVVRLTGGAVSAVGTHRELLDTDPEYLALVRRAEGD